MSRRGATFAYFSASNSTQGSNASETNVNTVEVGGTTFTLANNAGSTQNKLNYPGGMAIMKATATAKINSDNNTTTGNTYKFKYNLSLTGSSKVTGLKWYLYELDEKTQTTLDQALGEKFGLGACKLVSDTKTNGETHLYYTANGAATADGGQDCTISNLGIQTQLGEYEIASGTFSESGLTNTKNEEPKVIENLASFERTITGVTKTAEGKKYYYIVVEYPNDKNDQTSADEGQNINIKLELVENSVSVELAQ